MALNNLNRKTVIIDRTLPEIRDSLIKKSRLDILDLCWMIMNLGAEIVEADVGLLDKMGKLPEGLVFILKAGKIADLEACGKFRIRRCIMRRMLLEQPGIPEVIKRDGLYAVLEVRVNSIGGIRRLEELRELKNFDAVSCVRVSGLGRLDTPEWLETMQYIRVVLNKEIDICPDNRFSMGNAVALEAAANGIDYITTSFSGFGYDRSYASLEVVLSAMKMQRSGAGNMNPDVFSLLCEQFSKCTRIKMLENRPVLSGNPSNGIYIREPGGTMTFRELVDA